MVTLEQTLQALKIPVLEDGVVEHVVEDGLGEGVKLLQLRFLLVDDFRQQIKL